MGWHPRGPAVRRWRTGRLPDGQRRWCCPHEPRLPGSHSLVGRADRAMTDADVTTSHAPRPGILARAAQAVPRKTWFAHSSGYFGAKDYAWRTAFLYLRRRAVVITGTEA